MTDQETRITIAEACPTLFSLRDCNGHTILVDAQGDAVDPLDDLNCMHEAEQTLSFKEWTVYVDHLIDAPIPAGSTYRGYECIHAPARVRAQAFVRTIAARAEREVKP